MQEAWLSAYLSGREQSAEEKSAVLAYRATCQSRAMRPVHTMPNCGYSDNLSLLLCERPELSEHIRGRRVIELGPGFSSVAAQMLALGASSYVAVEPFHASDITLPPSCEVVQQEALGYLLSQPDNSAMVVSFGMMCPFLYEMSNLDYFRFVAKEIARVTPSGVFSVHVTDYSDSPSFYTEVGLKFYCLGIWQKPI